MSLCWLNLYRIHSSFFTFESVFKQLIKSMTHNLTFIIVIIIIFSDHTLYKRMRYNHTEPFILKTQPPLKAPLSRCSFTPLRQAIPRSKCQYFTSVTVTATWTYRSALQLIEILRWCSGKLLNGQVHVSGAAGRSADGAPWFSLYLDELPLNTKASHGSVEIKLIKVQCQDSSLIHIHIKEPSSSHICISWHMNRFINRDLEQSVLRGLQQNMIWKEI